MHSTEDPSSIPKTLIFVGTKDAAVKVYRVLHHSAQFKSLVSMFHTSLTQSTKTHIVEQFQSSSSQLRILVATVAFGMVCSPLHLVLTDFSKLYVQGMDIADIEMVVVHGVPDTVSQFYQVLHVHVHTCIHTFYVYDLHMYILYICSVFPCTQLCGRAGRSGFPARAHLFFTQKKISDCVLEQFCDLQNTENCLRGILLKGLESSCILRENAACCSVCCGGTEPYPKLNLVKQGRRCYQRKPPNSSTGFV